MTGGAIAAVVGVVDEVELIERCVRHLYAIGVDQVIVDDRGSTDGTLELVRDISQSTNLVLLEHGPGDPLDVTIRGASQLGLLRALGADWAIFLDADEFPLPATGSLRTTVAAWNFDATQVTRFNVAVTRQATGFADVPSPAQYGELHLFVRQPPGFSGGVEAAALAWSRGVPMPKAAVRPALATGLAPGFHRAELVDGGRPAENPPDDLVIAHLPFTTEGRFRRKVENIRRVMELHPDYFAGRQGWHWRRWRDMAERGELDGEFERQLLTPAEFELMRADGTVVSAADWFASRIPSASVSASRPA